MVGFRCNHIKLRLYVVVSCLWNGARSSSVCADERLLFISNSGLVVSSGRVMPATYEISAVRRDEYTYHCHHIQRRLSEIDFHSCLP